MVSSSGWTQPTAEPMSNTGLGLLDHPRAEEAGPEREEEGPVAPAGPPPQPVAPAGAPAQPVNPTVAGGGRRTPSGPEPRRSRRRRPPRTAPGRRGWRSRPLAPRSTPAHRARRDGPDRPGPDRLRPPPPPTPAGRPTNSSDADADDAPTEILERSMRSGTNATTRFMSGAGGVCTKAFAAPHAMPASTRSGRQIGEGGGRQIVDVGGEGPLGEGVPGHGSHAGRPEHVGRVANRGGADDRQRRGDLLVDVLRRAARALGDRPPPVP